jgi:hypothetical protein
MTKQLSEMTIVELLDEEAKASEKLAQSPAGSNASRVADRRIDRVLAEMQSRTSVTVLSASVILGAVLCLITGCAAHVAPQPLQDDITDCYVEPSETRCDYLPQSEPMYCHAPQTRPFVEYCESAALDTGTNVGSQWCCASVKINGTQP